MSRGALRLLRVPGNGQTQTHLVVWREGERQTEIGGIRPHDGGRTTVRELAVFHPRPWRMLLGGPVIEYQAGWQAAHYVRPCDRARIERVAKLAPNIHTPRGRAITEWGAGIWTVRRHSGRQRGRWVPVFYGPEADARARYQALATELRQGTAKLVDPSGKVAEQCGAPRLRSRW